MVNDFKGHSKDAVKKFVKGRLYSDESKMPEKMRYDLCTFLLWSAA